MGFSNTIACMDNFYYSLIAILNDSNVVLAKFNNKINNKNVGPKQASRKERKKKRRKKESDIFFKKKMIRCLMKKKIDSNRASASFREFKNSAR